MVDVAGFVTDLAYDATDLQHADLDWVMWIVRGLNEAPQVRGSDTVVPGMTGQVSRNRVADKLVIELKGWVLAHGATMADAVANFRQSMEALKTLFDTADDPRTLSCILEDGSSASITARVTGFSAPEVVPGHVADVSVAMESVDPYWTITS